MTGSFTIKWTPNENGFDRFVVRADTGLPECEVRTTPTNDSMDCIKELAAFLADCDSRKTNGWPEIPVLQPITRRVVMPTCPACGGDGERCAC